MTDRAPAPEPASEAKGQIIPARPHIVDGEFQSDKYPTCPRGKVPLSVKDSTAQDLLWEYAQRRRSVDAEFSGDLEFALRGAGYVPPVAAPEAKVEETLAIATLRKLERDFGMAGYGEYAEPLRLATNALESAIADANKRAETLLTERDEMMNDVEHYVLMNDELRTVVEAARKVINNKGRVYETGAIYGLENALRALDAASPPDGAPCRDEFCSAAVERKGEFCPRHAADGASAKPCEWYGDSDDGESSEHCTTGKPATYINCFLMPAAKVCVDHKCRCKQPAQPPDGATVMAPQATAESILIEDRDEWKRRATAAEERAEEMLAACKTAELRHENAVAESEDLRAQLEAAKHGKNRPGQGAQGPQHPAVAMANDAIRAENLRNAAPEPKKCGRCLGWRMYKGDDCPDCGGSGEERKP